MKRIAILGGVGVLVLVLAIGLNYWTGSTDDAEVASAPAGDGQDAAPAPAASAPQVPAETAPAVAPDGSKDAQASGAAPDKPVPPSFDVVRVDPQGNAVIAGRAAPNAVVIIRDGDKEIGRAQADARGEWVFVPDVALPAGSREFSLSALAEDGSETDSETKVVLAVPESSGNAGEQPAPIALEVRKDDASGAAKVLQAPGAQPADGGLAVRGIEYGKDGNLALSGTAAPNAEVRVYLDDIFVGTARADETGHWELVPESDIAAGQYTLRVDQLGVKAATAEGAGGSAGVSARIELPFV
ncbi:MAG: hypothetical protein O3A96_17200, partial [Proteobacteria bacterium]|nr:hypothetical protein [Pseudomonadota bacterium]